MRAPYYIELMRSPLRSIATAAFALAIAVGFPGEAHAQIFEADYQLVRQHSPVRFTIHTGSSWFGQVDVERSTLQQLPGNPRNHPDIVNLGAGYRFSNGQSLSLQLSHGHGRGPGQRLGLAVNYDWPQYFVRFSYDQGINLVPQDNLRFSAGVRF